MKPVFALVGRPNVGKSTLFNKLTRTRDAIVADMPGLTRDRQYGNGKVGDNEYIVIDTGGLSGEKESLDESMARQTLLAIEDADVILFLVDGRAGLSPADEELAVAMRRFSKPVVLVVNKTDGLDVDRASSEFYSLGFSEQAPISAAHSRGIVQLAERAHSLVEQTAHDPDDADPEDEKRIRIAIVGRPNAGKSTLINRLVGEERVVASNIPGTTRDSVNVPFERNRVLYTLIDTAGVRRRGKVKETVEKFSVIKTLQSIDAAHVAALMLDAQEGIADQDLHLADYIISSGRALVVAINKCDGLNSDDIHDLKRDIDRRMQFATFARFHFISALRGTRVGQLIKSIYSAYRSSMVDMSTPELTRMLEYAVQQHQPPLANGRRIKLRYAHQGGSNPPLIVVHGNQTEKVPTSYQRYLSNFFIDALKLEGTPLRMEFKSSKNPYEGKKKKTFEKRVAGKTRTGKTATRQSEAKSRRN